MRSIDDACLYFASVVLEDILKILHAIRERLDGILLTGAGRLRNRDDIYSNRLGQRPSAIKLVKDLSGQHPSITRIDTIPLLIRG
jgi:hypothetical protein